MFDFGTLPNWNDITLSKQSCDLDASYDPVSGHLCMIAANRTGFLHAVLPALSVAKKSAGKLLVARIVASPLAVRGEAWTYTLDMLSLPEPVTFALGKAPEGMSIDAKGVLTWKVPLTFSAPLAVEVHVTQKYGTDFLSAIA